MHALAWLFLCACAPVWHVTGLLRRSLPVLMHHAAPLRLSLVFCPSMQFPIVWSTIGLLRCASSVMVWEACGRDALALPLIVMCTHLAIGDCWWVVTPCDCVWLRIRMHVRVGLRQSIRVCSRNHTA